MNSKIIYCCMECGNKISRNGALLGQGLCRSCSAISLYERGILNNKGKNHPMFGKKKPQSEETKKKISKTLKGIKRGPQSKEHREKLSQVRIERKIAVGQNNNLYIDGRTPLTKAIRGVYKHFNWRTSVFERDNYTCQQCNQHGGNLEAHHKKEFYKILNEFLQKYNKFSPVKDKEILLSLAISYEPFWDLDNGETQCKNCHDKTKGRFRNNKSKEVKT